MSFGWIPAGAFVVERAFEWGDINTSQMSAVWSAWVRVECGHVRRVDVERAYRRVTPT